MLATLAVPSIRPVSRRRFARPAGDLIEACVPCPTRAYYQHLLDAGKTTREARRCGKRALARHFYNRLRTVPLTT